MEVQAMMDQLRDNPALDYHANLGVSRDASPEDMKQAYRQAAMSWHPDRMASLPEAQQAAAKAKWQSVKDAYEVLTDDDLRKKYEAHRGNYEAHLASAANRQSAASHSQDAPRGAAAAGKVGSGQGGLLSKFNWRSAGAAAAVVAVLAGTAGLYQKIVGPDEPEPRFDPHRQISPTESYLMGVRREFSTAILSGPNAEQNQKKLGLTPLDALTVQARLSDPKVSDTLRKQLDQGRKEGDRWASVTIEDVGGKIDGKSVRVDLQRDRVSLQVNTDTSRQVDIALRLVDSAQLGADASKSREELIRAFDKADAKNQARNSGGKKGPGM